MPGGHMLLFQILLSFLLLLSSTAANSDSSLAEQSIHQAGYYINQIEAGRNTDENLWALTLLGSEDAKVRAFVEDEIQRDNYRNQALFLFEEFAQSYEEQLGKIVFKTGSPDLLAALLLSTEKDKKELLKRFKSKFRLPETDHVNYASLCQSIISESQITENILSSKRYLLPHFFILFDSEHKEFINSDYLSEIENNWQDFNPSVLNLKSNLLIATYFRVLYLQNQYAQIDPLYNSLTSEKNIFPNSSLKLRIYRYLDFSMYQLGYYDRSLEVVRNFTLPLVRRVGKKITELSIEIDHGTNLYGIGKVKEAKSVFENIISNAKKNNINLPESVIFNNLALTYYKTGNYDKYLNLQFQALKVAKQEDNYTHQLKIYDNLFTYYRKFNDKQNALTFLEKAQKLASKEGHTEDLGRIYMLTGSFFREFENDFDKAHNYYSQAISILKPKNDTWLYIETLNEQAETYEEQEEYKQTLELYDQIIALTPSENNPNHLDALINKALNNLKLGNIDRAEEIIYKFQSYDLTQLDFEQIIKAKTVEADYLNRIGKTEKALNILPPALSQVVERAKSSADLQTGFWHVEDEYLDAFELAVNILIDNNRNNEAVQLLDQLKTINEASLYQNPLVKASLLNESQLTQYKNLTNQLDATRKKLLTAPESQRFEIQQTINQLKLKKRMLDKKLTTEMDSDPISIREIQNKISGRELVMHITELNEQYYIANITRSDVSMKVLPFDSTKKKLFSDAVKQVSTHKTDLDSLYTITNFLEIKEIPDLINKITIIPDSYLYQLPIDILPLEVPTHSYSYGEVRYLIEKFNTRYLTSLNDFKPNANEPANSRYEQNFAGYGISNFGEYRKKKLVPLPFAQTEVTTIAERLTQLPNKRTYINNASTKNTFMQTAPRSGILHLATHSEISERDPLFSTIYMSKTTNNIDSTFQDQIFAYELFELNLNNEMIMLNSCESGSGSYIQGTGVMGISRALHYAGANSLILNLWSVNDMLASDFAIYFYDQLNKGKSKSEALRSTKQHFLRTKNASPHFWGPYMLIGNNEPVVHPNRTMNLAVAGTFIFYFLLMIGLSYLKGRGKSTTQTVQHKEAA